METPLLSELQHEVLSSVITRQKELYKRLTREPYFSLQDFTFGDLTSENPGIIGLIVERNDAFLGGQKQGYYHEALLNAFSNTGEFQRIINELPLLFVALPEYPHKSAKLFFDTLGYTFHHNVLRSSALVGSKSATPTFEMGLIAAEIDGITLPPDLHTWDLVDINVSSKSKLAATVFALGIVMDGISGLIHKPLRNKLNLEEMDPTKILKPFKGYTEEGVQEHLNAIVFGTQGVTHLNGFWNIISTYKMVSEIQEGVLQKVLNLDPESLLLPENRRNFELAKCIINTIAFKVEHNSYRDIFPADKKYIGKIMKFIADGKPNKAAEFMQEAGIWQELPHKTLQLFTN